MGAIFQLLTAAFRFAAPASIGYFFNDVASFVGKFVPSAVDQTNGQLKIWAKILLFLVLGVVGVLVLKMIMGKGKSKKAFFTIAALLLTAYSFTVEPELGFVTATVLATLTTGAAAVTTAFTTYVPRYFMYAAATQLTGVKITVQGDGVIFDSDANGLTHCGVNRVIGQVTNGYLFRIANGFIQGKNVMWEFTNSAAQTPIVYIDSDATPAKGSALYLQLLRQQAIGPGGTDFTNFATLSAPSMAATDYVNVLYSDGTNQSNILRNDLQQLLGYTQNVVNTPVYQIDNFSQNVSRVNFQATATQTIYLQRWMAPVGDGMINQAPIARG